MQYVDVEDTEACAWSSERPLLSEVVTTPTGVCWRRVDPQSGEVCRIAEFEAQPSISELLTVSDGFEVLVALRERQAPREDAVWVRVPSLGGWPPDLGDTRALLAPAIMELHRKRSGGAVQDQRIRRNLDRSDHPVAQVMSDRIYQQLTSVDLLESSTWIEDLRIGEAEIAPGSWARAWPPSKDIADVQDDSRSGECRWYERLHGSRALRYFAYPDWGRLDLPIAIHTDQGWKGAFLGRFDVGFPVPIAATLCGNYLLLCGSDGYGYRARLYELSSGNPIWSSGRNSYASFWPLLRRQSGFAEFRRGC